jgi:hypothetical protein
MASGFTINYATSPHHHYVVCLIQGHCGMYLIYLNIKFVTDFRHIGSFLLVFRCPQQPT